MIVSFKNKWVIWGFAIIAVLVLPVIFLYPFNVDVDRWQWIADTYVRFGGLPYLAAWDHDFPGVLIVHFLSIYLFGNSMLAFRTVEYIWIFVTLLALFRASRLWLTRSESFLGSLIFSLFYSYGRWDCMGQRDNFAVLPIVLAIFCFVSSARKNSPKLSYWLMASGGAMIGVATCIRPTYAILLFVPFFSINKITNFRSLLWGSIGFLTPIALMILPFALIPGGIYQAYASAVLYNTDVFSHIPPTAARFVFYLRSLLELRTLFIFILSTVWVAYVVRSRARNIACSVPERKEGIFLFLLMVTLLIGMFAQQSLSAIHFTPFYACFIPILGKMLIDITQRMKGLQPAAMAAVLIVIGALLYPWGLVRSYVEQGFSLRAAYHYFPGTLQNLHEDSIIRSLVIHHTAPNDFIEVIGDPGLSWRTPRRMASEFPDPWNFLLPGPSGRLTDYQMQWEKQFMESLYERSPKYIIIQNQLGIPSVPHLPQLQDLLRRHYVLDAVLESHTIYSKR